MKQMRSRFRLITLLLVCAFLLMLVLCTGSSLKTAGISLSSLPALPVIGGTVSPEPSVSPGSLPEETFMPVPAAPDAEESAQPATDNYPEQEYNLFGL